MVVQPPSKWVSFPLCSYHVFAFLPAILYVSSSPFHHYHLSNSIGWVRKLECKVLFHIFSIHEEYTKKISLEKYIWSEASTTKISDIVRIKSQRTALILWLVCLPHHFFHNIACTFVLSQYIIVKNTYSPFMHVNSKIQFIESSSAFLIIYVTIIYNLCGPYNSCTVERRTIVFLSRSTEAAISSSNKSLWPSAHYCERNYLSFINISNRFDLQKNRKK